MKNMKKLLVASAIIGAGAAADAALVRLVPETGVSKAFTLKTDSDTEYVVRFYRPDVFRVEAAPKIWEGEGTNRTYTVDYTDTKNKPEKAQILVPEYAEDATGVEFADADGRFTLKTSDIVVTFDKASERMSVTDFRGNPLFAETSPVSFKTTTSVTEATADTPAKTNVSHKCVQSIASDKSERIYGGGQQVGRLMHKGRKLLIDCDYNWADGGAPNPAPFVMSSKGWGMMRHTFAAGSYDFTADDVSALEHSENRFDAFYFCGGSFAKVIDRYTEATGRPNLIPMWGLELGDADAYMTREKDTKYPKQEEDGSFTEVTPDVIRKVAMAYRDDDMPAGWILVNDGYGCGYTMLASVVEALRELDFKTGLWTEGALDRIAWEVGTAGTRVQKLDVAWTSQGGEYKMQHALQCNADAFNGITGNSDARAFCWTVLGWAGTQRYSICWAGDEYGGWDLIRYMIPTVTGSSMSGQAYATTDVDGIFGGSNETYLRDLQWKCWTTAMYVMNGWSHVNKSPWSLPEPYKSLCRDALKRKIRLTPFFYSLMRESWETGAAIVRPMVWNYPQDPETFDERTKHQFMVGDDILVAPVYTSMKINNGWWRKGIYLPEGDWYDYNDGRRVKGGQWIKAYPVELGKLPVFVRAGAILPMYPEALTTSGSDKSTLTFDIWPRAIVGGHFTVYEDDGETRAYERGEFSRQPVMVAPHIASLDAVIRDGKMNEDWISDFTVRVGPANGDFKGKCKTRAYEFAIHTQAKPAKVLVKADATEVLALESTNCVKRLYANVKQGWYYDPEEKGGTLHVKLLPGCTARTVELEVRMASALAARAASPAYPQPTAEEEVAADEAAKEKAVELIKRNAKYTDGDDMVAKDTDRIVVGPLDGTFTRITGHVASHPDNKPGAKFTFRILADNKQIFERANMNSSQAPQLIAVDIPSGAHWIKFEFTADDESAESKSAKGVWKNVEFVSGE